MSGESEFDEFYVGTVRRTTLAVFAMLGDMAEAEDAVAEAYTRAWARWSSVSVMSDPAGWVRTVAYRLKVSAWRSAVRRIAAHRRFGVVPDTPGLNADHVAVVAALRQLPETQRRAIVLHHMVGLTVQEVAVEVQAPVGTVKARLVRGRAKLAALLADPETEKVRTDV